jgi:hypothetical protein
MESFSSDVTKQVVDYIGKSGYRGRLGMSNIFWGIGAVLANTPAMSL